MAKKAAAALGSDLLKVEAEKAYGSFFSSVLRVLKEKKKGITPPAKTQTPALDSYDTVLIGYPVWASDIPSFFADFIRKCNLKGKKVIPFATSGGSGIEGSMKTIKAICPESEIIHPYNHENSKKDNFEKWIEAVRG